MDPGIAIRAERLTKIYRLGNTVGARLLTERIGEMIRFRRKNGAAERSFSAIDDVSFEIPAGEAVGIIGSNGAGKTTLLKIVSRVTRPTTGTVSYRGRVGSLLEVGSGFHAELTGRENIFMNGAILGMRKAAIRRRFDEIVEFAGVERFLDTPVKRYSSGMYVRLAFAVAAHLETDILLVDEVLAVGDVAFQRKCLGKMGEVAAGGRTVLFVSHNLATVTQLTTTSLLLQAGRLAAQGPTRDLVQRYIDSIGTSMGSLSLENARRPADVRLQVEMISAEWAGLSVLESGEPIIFLLTVRANVDVGEFGFYMTLYRYDRVPVGSALVPGLAAPARGEIRTFRIELPNPALAPGKYYFVLATGRGDEREGGLQVYDIVEEVMEFETGGQVLDGGIVAQWLPEWGSIRLEKPLITPVDLPKERA